MMLLLKTEWLGRVFMFLSFPKNFWYSKMCPLRKCCDTTKNEDEWADIKSKKDSCRLFALTQKNSFEDAIQQNIFCTLCAPRSRFIGWKQWAKYNFMLNLANCCWVGIVDASQSAILSANLATEIVYWGFLDLVTSLMGVYAPDYVNSSLLAPLAA